MAQYWRAPVSQNLKSLATVVWAVSNGSKQVLSMGAFMAQYHRVLPIKSLLNKSKKLHASNDGFQMWNWWHPALSFDQDKLKEV